MKSAHGKVLVLAVWAAMQLGTTAAADAPSPGSAASFAVLGGSAVTNRGTSQIIGNVGVSPGDGVTGFAAGSLTGGEVHRDDALARAAQHDARRLAEILGSGACTPMHGATLRPGIYCVTAPLAGRLTLAGDADAVWIFRSPGALQTHAGSSIVLKNGASANHLFWQVAGSATLGPNTRFAGTLLADGDIVLQTAASLDGRALAGGAVTLDGNVVTVCGLPGEVISSSAEVPALSQWLVIALAALLAGAGMRRLS